MGLSFTSILNILIIAIVFFTLVPLGIIYTFRSMKFIQNFDISERKERIKPFIVIIGSYVAGLIIFFLLHPQPNYLPVYFTSCYIINAIVGSAITTRWKISIHSAGIASFSAIIIYLFETNLMAQNFIFDHVLVWSSLIIIPIIMWGRIKLHLHTISQTIAGAVIGFIITYLELKIMIG
jgi:membrane-associated phospholipid phosphatase